MLTLIILLIVGILLVILQRALVIRYGKSGLLSFLYAIAYLAVAVPVFLLVLFNQHIFKDFESYAISLFSSLFSPRIIDFFLGIVAAEIREHDKVLA